MKQSSKPLPQPKPKIYLVRKKYKRQVEYLIPGTQRKKVIPAGRVFFVKEDKKTKEFDSVVKAINIAKQLRDYYHKKLGDGYVVVDVIEKPATPTLHPFSDRNIIHFKDEVFVYNNVGMFVTSCSKDEAIKLCTEHDYTFH